MLRERHGRSNHSLQCARLRRRSWLGCRKRVGLGIGEGVVLDVEFLGQYEGMGQA
jgi:hypothetical protein